MSLVLVRSIEIHSFLFCNGCLMDVKKCICSDFPDAISIITYFCVDVDCFFKNKMQDLQNKLTFWGFYGTELMESISRRDFRKRNGKSLIPIGF